MLQTYSLHCDCGERITFSHPGPTTQRDTVVLRQACPACVDVLYVTIPGANAYKMRADTLELQEGILDIFAEQAPPLTVRQVYYQATVMGLVQKTEAGYDRVQSQLTSMRRAGSVPYDWIADSSRHVFRTTLYADATDALTRMQEYYRRDLWQGQDVQVQVWVEKKALIGVLWPICREFGVPLYPCGGYSSITFAYEAAQELRAADKPVFVYHLGDFDADGVHAAATLEAELLTHGARVEFRRLGLDWHHVVEHNLPTRPQKKTSSRLAWFVERYGNLPACELDALPAVELRQLVHNAITAHINPWEWERLQAVEAEEKRSLAMIAAHGLTLR